MNLENILEIKGDLWEKEPSLLGTKIKHKYGNSRVLLRTNENVVLTSSYDAKICLKNNVGSPYVEVRSMKTGIHKFDIRGELLQSIILDSDSNTVCLNLH